MQGSGHDEKKVPCFLFPFGVIQNLIRCFLIGLIGLVLLIIGAIWVPICKIIGITILACYILLSIIKQCFIRAASLKESDNPEFDQFMDAAFGVNNPDENASSTRERIMKIVEDKIKSQDTDSND